MAVQDTAKAEQDTPKQQHDTPEQGQVSDMKSVAETIENTSAPSQGPALEADLQAHIGRQLRAVYDEVVSEGVPDRFVQLLEELARKKNSEEA